MRYFVFVLTLLAGVNFLSAQGSPPFNTDDAATVCKGQWELDLGVSTERSRSGDRSWTLPSADLAFGLTDAVEFDYGVGWVGSRIVDEPRRSGLGNSVVGIKWRFLEEKPFGFAASIDPQFEFNNNSSSHERGLVEKGSVLILPLQVAKTIGGVSTAVNVGRTFYSHEPRENDGWFAGLAAGREVAEKLYAGAEIYGETSRRFNHGWLLVNIGACYTVNDNLSFSFAVGRGISGEERPDYTAFLGVQLVR